MSFFNAGARTCSGSPRLGAGFHAAHAVLAFSVSTAFDARAENADARPDTSNAASQAASAAPVRSLGVVTVFGRQPTSLPTQIPATLEGVTREQIEQTVNATDSEDALKFLPSLLVRKRYIGDYNHAVLSSRASGTGNSARSAVYADGVLLSNYLGNGVGGLSFAPRWNMVTPEEIERVDVMYGPFAAAYPGNSVGAVVAFTTRMPTAFEVHAKAGYTVQPFELYRTDATFRTWESSASVGNQSDALAWRLGFSHTDSHGQPLTFATRLLSAGTASTAGTAVTGAMPGANNAGLPWYLLGTGTEYRSQQDDFKARLAYDLTPSLRLNYLVGVWQNRADSQPLTYLRNAAGAPVYNGAINIDGLAFTGAQGLSGADFAATAERLTHVMQGLTLKSHTRGEWDWELTASHYDYAHDDKRQNAASTPLPSGLTGGTGTLADGRGSGWTQLAAKAIWRPDAARGAHIVEVGVQQDRYALRYVTTALAHDWTTEDASAAAAARAGSVRGDTSLHSVHAQDAWAFASRWKAVLGLRAEEWTATDGATEFSASSNLHYPTRRARFASPKAALAFQAADDWVLKASLGRAVRMPTVSELYGATSTSNSQYINDPTLAPERSWTTELSAEKDLGEALLRLTYFTETTRDSLYSQTTFDATANKNISRVQNIARIETRGLELAFQGSDVGSVLGSKGLDLSASTTFADSVITDNAGFVLVPGDTIGKRQPNIPAWRASALVSQRFHTDWTLAFGARYSGQQYRTLNNADLNGATYQGASRYFTTDVRLRHQFTRQWSGAVGIDNLNNFQYWNFHPYPQRSYSAELRFDL